MTSNAHSHSHQQVPHLQEMLLNPLMSPAVSRNGLGTELTFTPTQVYQLQLLRNAKALELLNLNMGTEPTSQMEFIQQQNFLRGQLDLLTEIAVEGSLHIEQAPEAESA